MKVVRAKSSWLYEEGLLLDSAFHTSDGRLAKTKIENSRFNTGPLKEVTSNIFNGPRFPRRYVTDPERGIPFLSSSDIVRSDLSNVKLLSKKYTANLEKLIIRKGWIVISCSGTIGNMTYCREDMDGIAASQHVMRVVPNREIPSGYLYAFLASHYGKSMITQGTYGAVIQHIEPHHISNLPIPLLASDVMTEIHNLIEEAARLRTEANYLLNILHRFNSPKWLSHIQKSSIALKELTTTQLANLQPGEAFLWANKATNPEWTRKAIKVTTRPRVTKHGGSTQKAVG